MAWTKILDASTIPEQTLTVFLSILWLQMLRLISLTDHWYIKCEYIRLSRNSESLYAIQEVPTDPSECIHLTHWGRVSHICASELTIIGSDSGLSRDRRQAIIWTGAGIFVNSNVRNKSQWDLKRNVIQFFFFQENAFERIVCKIASHDGVIKWKHFPRSWPFVWEFTGPSEFPAQRPVARNFGVLRRHHGHYDATAMYFGSPSISWRKIDLKFRDNLYEGLSPADAKSLSGLMVPPETMEISLKVFLLKMGSD